MTDTQEEMREFHAWNEELSGNENQEICKYRMQGWMGHAAQSAEKMARLEAENNRLRTILCDCLVALDNGSGALPDCSMQFMADIPKEIAAETKERKRKLAAAELSNKQLRDLRYELAGIAADVDAGKGFDIVCRKTLRRVMDALAQQPSTEALDAYVAKLIPPGWKVVPVEPTIEMTNAAHDAEHCGNSEPHFANAWMAMLNAAPIPPAPEKE